MTDRANPLPNPTEAMSLFNSSDDFAIPQGFQVPQGPSETLVFTENEIDKERQNRTKLSGGELPPAEAEEYASVRKLMLGQDDVHAVHALSRRVDGLWLYLIETPFRTFPKFVIGLAASDLSEINLLHQCGQRWSADAAWDRLRHNA